MDPLHPQQFIRLKKFIELMGWSRSTYYNRVRCKAIPKAQSNGPGTKGYYANVVAEIQRSLAD